MNETMRAVDTRLCEEKYLSISNNDSGYKKIANLYEDINDQVIDFNNRDLIYDEPLIPFVLQGCKNLTLKNMTIDFRTPFFFQAQVIAIDNLKQTIDMKVMEECIYDVRGRKLFFRGKDYEFKWHGRGSVPALSTKDMTWEQNFVWNMWFREDKSTPFEEASYYIKEDYTCEEIEPGILRFYNAMDKLPDMGWHVVIKGKKEPNRRWPGIFMEDCENIRLENVTVHNSSGMALIAQRCDGISLENYSVKLREDSNRVCTSTADGSHFSGCKGKISMNNCFFENMLDDALNVHGIFVLFEEFLDEHTVLCKIGHSQQMGVTFAGEGDVIRAYEANTFSMIDEYKVRSVEKVNRVYFKMVLEAAIDKSIIRSGVVFDNKTWQPQVLVSSCSVINNRARSLLLQTEEEVVIEHNIFYGPSMNCIQFSGDTNFWFESGFVNDVVIRDNVFKHIRDYIFTAYIEVDSDIKYHHNINIINNKLYLSNNKIFNIYSVDHLTFANNQIYHPDGDKNDQMFVTDNCNDVVIENNQWGEEDE